MDMPSFSRNDVALVAYPFFDRSGVKVRPAVVVSGEHRSRDVFVVPLTELAKNCFPLHAAKFIHVIESCSTVAIDTQMK